MSAFAEKGFKAGNYLHARPHYPASLYQFISSYSSQSSHSLAIDVGCGPGEASLGLTNFYEKVIGIDASSVMIDTANEKYALNKSVEFVKGSGNDILGALEQLPDLDVYSILGSISLITVAQAFHWFDSERFFAAAARLLAPSSCVAIWGYVDPVFLDYPQATKTFLRYCYDSNCMGPYWEQPGRDILKHKYRDVNVPPEQFTKVERYLDPPFYELKKQVSVADMRDYMRTFSAYHNWQSANPKAADVVDQCFDELQTTIGWTDDTVVQVQWDTVLLIAQKK